MLCILYFPRLTVVQYDQFGIIKIRTWLAAEEYKTKEMNYEFLNPNAISFVLNPQTLSQVRILIIRN